MDLRIFDSAAEIARAASEIFVQHIKKFPNACLGLATGASPLETYRCLIEDYQKGLVSFRQVRTFNLDEYCDLPEEDKNSYHSFMKDNLFSHIDISMENTHFPNGNAADMEAECKRYDQLILSSGGIDIQLLGIGVNGHIGFNEPSDVFSEGTNKVRLTESTIRSNKIYFQDGKMPTYAVTMGIGSIMNAKKIILLAIGEGKAEAIRRTVKGELTPNCPASILQKHPDATLLIDREAAKKL